MRDRLTGALSLVGDSDIHLLQTGDRLHLAQVTVGDSISGADWIPHHGAGQVAGCKHKSFSFLVRDNKVRDRLTSCLTATNRLFRIVGVWTITLTFAFSLIGDSHLLLCPTRQSPHMLILGGQIQKTVLNKVPRLEKESTCW